MLVRIEERVIHPGWTTSLFEDSSNGEWLVTHKCVTCGDFVIGRPGDRLLSHAIQKHRAQSFSLELYNFKSEVHQRDFFFGLKAFMWPDKATRGF
jgi:hypothetical protein